jgi:ATP-binding cassette, subfamily F, member 3
MRAKDVLLNALSEYNGTVVFVSHDRYFIDKLATRVFEVGEGKVEIYPGNYEDYLWRKQGGAARMQETLVAASTIVPPANGKPAEPSTDNKSKRLNPIKRKQLEDRVKELEKSINRLETSIAVHETALQSFVSSEETERHSRELGNDRAELQKCLAEWEELGQTLEVESN